MIRLALRVGRDQSELVLAELLELAPGGVEELDAGAGVVEYAVYGAPGELPALPDLRALAGAALVEVTTREVPDDWQERWRGFHRPVLIEGPAGALYVRPPWEPPRAGSAHEIVIDPGQAFGTGAHATTRQCLELLLELAADPWRSAVIDLGTGSGVLAIAAAHLGFTPVLGLDIEPESVRAAHENARVNGAEIEVRRHDLRSEPLPPTGQPPLVLANLLAPLLVELAPRLGRPPRALIAGGMLLHEADAVAAAMAERAGLRERARRHSGEWAALWLEPE